MLAFDGDSDGRRLDVTSADDWSALADWLRDEHGEVHGLVNNAGVAARERLPHVSLDAWHRTFDINVTGPMLGIQALVPLMRPGASIVNICSVAAVSGHAAAAYTSSKWALRGLTRAAALELGSQGIRVNAVMPGLVDTPLMESASPAFFEAALAEIPLARVGTPADIAPTIVFLLSDDAAYYNGAEIVIDGGLTAHVSHKRIADATRPALLRFGRPWRGRGRAHRRRGVPAARRPQSAPSSSSASNGRWRSATWPCAARVPLRLRRSLLPYQPPSVRDFVTFESHVEGVRRSVDGASGVPEAWYDAPTFYFTNPHALYGPGPIPKPRGPTRSTSRWRSARSWARTSTSSATRSSTTGPPVTSSRVR